MYTTCSYYAIKSNGRVCDRTGGGWFVFRAVRAWLCTCSIGLSWRTALSRARVSRLVVLGARQICLHNGVCTTAPRRQATSSFAWLRFVASFSHRRFVLDHGRVNICARDKSIRQSADRDETLFVTFETTPVQRKRKGAPALQRMGSLPLSCLSDFIFSASAMSFSIISTSHPVLSGSRQNSSI